MSYEVAQVNIARLAADLDSPRLADFVSAHPGNQVRRALSSGTSGSAVSDGRAWYS